MWCWPTSLYRATPAATALPLSGQSGHFLVGPASLWCKQTLAIPARARQARPGSTGPRHALRAQFDALCLSAGVKPRIRAEVDDMAHAATDRSRRQLAHRGARGGGTGRAKSKLLVKVGESADLKKTSMRSPRPTAIALRRLERLLKGLALAPFEPGEGQSVWAQRSSQPAPPPASSWVTPSRM